MTVTHTVATTPLGDLTLVADDGVLTGDLLSHHWHRPGPSGFGERDDRGFGPVREQLAEYIAGQRTCLMATAPPRADGDEFQHRVWDVIAAIPYGETVSYGEIARRLGDGVLAKDVGSATGRNPLSVVVPCHRVVGKDGALTGYAGGLSASATCSTWGRRPSSPPPRTACYESALTPPSGSSRACATARIERSAAINARVAEASGCRLYASSSASAAFSNSAERRAGSADPADSEARRCRIDSRHGPSIRRRTSWRSCSSSAFCAS